ncbi:MAG: flagellar type III secretion system pore protein FliP [Phycisphaerales bacterium]
MIGRARLIAAAWIGALAAVLALAPAPAKAQDTFGPPNDLPTSTAPSVTPPPDLLGGGESSDPMNPLAVLASAGDALPGASGGDAGSGGGPAKKGGLSTAINVMLVLTVITLVPSIMLMCTSFLRIIVVLGLLKQAMGTQQLPPPQVITGLALAMTLLVMSPTIDRVNREAIEPYRAGKITSYEELWSRAKQPLRDFMFDQIRVSGNGSSLLMTLNYRGVDTSRPELITEDQVDMICLVPAFVLSELKTAFLMGFKVYLPFLVIDMVISSLLISMSMMMLPPVLISLPFKLLLFVMVDGWQLVVGSLLTSFAQPVAPASVSVAWPVIEPAVRLLTG